MKSYNMLNSIKCYSYLVKLLASIRYSLLLFCLLIVLYCIANINNSLNFVYANSKISQIQVKEFKANDTNITNTEINSIVAYVGNHVITSLELEKEVNQWIQEITQKNKTKITTKEKEQLSKNILEQMINRIIVLDYANNTGVSANDSEINNTINDLMRANNIGPAEFDYYLKSKGSTIEEVRNRIIDQIIIGKLKQRDIMPKIKINEDEVEKLVKVKTNNLEEKYELKMIFVTQYNKALQVYHQLKNTNNNLNYHQEIATSDVNSKNHQSIINFEQLAKIYSEASTKDNGGYIGWRSAQELPRNVVAAVQNLEFGQITPILPNQQRGFFIFQLINKNKFDITNKVITKQYRIFRLLIRLSEVKDDKDVYQEIDNLRNKILTEADVSIKKITNCQYDNSTKHSKINDIQSAILTQKNNQRICIHDANAIEQIKKEIINDKFTKYAIIHSEDYLTSVYGGDLGWVNVEQLPKEWLDAINNTYGGEKFLYNGAITTPISTINGWEILQVTNMRSVNATLDNFKNTIRANLYNRRSNIEFFDYMKTLRNNSYVEYVE